MSKAEPGGHRADGDTPARRVGFRRMKDTHLRDRGLGGLSVLAPTVRLMPHHSRPTHRAAHETLFRLSDEWALAYQPSDADSEECFLVQRSGKLPGGEGRVHLGRLLPG